MIPCPTQTSTILQNSWRIALANFTARDDSNTPIQNCPTIPTVPFSTPDNMADALKDSPIKAVQVEALVCDSRTLCDCPTSPSDSRRL